MRIALRGFSLPLFIKPQGFNKGGSNLITLSDLITLKTLPLNTISGIKFYPLTIGFWALNSCMSSEVKPYWKDRRKKDIKPGAGGSHP
jgi:hypothetical protein